MPSVTKSKIGEIVVIAVAREHVLQASLNQVLVEVFPVKALFLA
jgi:hypothetical protein